MVSAGQFIFTKDTLKSVAGTYDYVVKEFDAEDVAGSLYFFGDQFVLSARREISDGWL